MKIVTVAIFGKIFAFHPVMLHQSPLLLSVQTYYQTISLILSKVINLHFWLGATQNKFQEIELSDAETLYRLYEMETQNLISQI